ncbi:hypothetical protein SAMN05443572_105480 [Myxococcus fulvus]|uniref:Lipoprotein n=1 Tax=Myxococcus fulvus TaxID=33 RepID=A0A511T4X7_MYXFU|nr:hypothetical protein [Myxococcus fulvus]GEN09226.1 hypothetical protein MFU01_42630 [Myxococcus fulvus]SEU16523.1 hypothetical protein SAMN05443572_105480 [Myxococcus fulvus]
MCSLRRLTAMLLLLLAFGCGQDGLPENEAEPLAARADPAVRGDWTIQNACGNAGTTPQIFTNTLMSPPALNMGGGAPANWNPESGRIRRGGIEYVSANGLRFELITDRCTYIKEVKVGSRVLTSTYTDGYWYSATDASYQPADPSRYGYNLWIFFPYLGDGSTNQVTITVGRTFGSGVATYSFPMVQVDTVEASYASAPMGFSRAELWNMFGKALYEKFNRETNSTVITSTDGSMRRIYDYDPSSLQLSVTSNGVGFSFKFKTDINNWCDPTIRAYGTFKLKADFSGISVDWVTAPQASLDWPFLCNAVQVVPILGLIPNLIYDIVESEAAGSMSSTIENSIIASLPGTGSVQLFLDGSTTRTNELLVNLKLPAPSIKINVPYDAFDMTRSATLFPSGENLTLLASGLGVNDYVAGVTPQTTLYSGPGGVPRYGSTTWPNPQTLSRASNPVWYGQPIARLLARTWPTALSTSTYQYTSGCTFKAHNMFGNASVRFGVNDTATDAQRLRGVFGAAPGYSLRVVFLNEFNPTTGDGASRCGSMTSGPVVSSDLSVLANP